MTTQTDGELMRELRLRRRDALEILYDRYARLVYSYAVRASGSDTLARETVQAVFTRLWTTKADYDASKGTYVSWLLTITRNISIDLLRRERRHARNVPLDQLQGRSGTDPREQPETDAIRKSERSEVSDAASKLTEAQRRVIDLLYWKGYTLREIADLGEEPLGTVKNRLHQALKTLRAQLSSLREGR
jgi:RNA polymerase sigma-70 factor (ECF subfamily)